MKKTPKSLPEGPNNKEARAQITANINAAKKKGIGLPHAIKVLPGAQPVAIPQDYLSQCELGFKFLEWVKLNKDVLCWEEFPNEFCMSPYRFKHLQEKNEYFKEAFSQALAILAVRQKKGAWTRKLDASVFKTMSAYCPEYKEIQDEESKEHKGGGTINVIMDAIKDDPLVPLIKKDEE